MLRLFRCVREYKKPTWLTLLFILGEAVVETFIPFVTANLVERLQAGAQLHEILQLGGLLILLA